MSYILTLSDRTVIQTLLKVGYSQKQIAEEVGVAPSTINYELKRYPKGYYDADQAQEDYEKKLTHRGRKTLLTEHLREFVRGIILEQRWSFEVIAHILQMPFKTLYNWLDKGWLDIRGPSFQTTVCGTERATTVVVSTHVGRSLSTNARTRLTCVKRLVILKSIPSYQEKPGARS